MSGFDELFLKAKELANVAGNKAQELTELAKLRMQATQLKSDIDANYRKLGEIIYELNKAGAENEELIEMCIAEITAQLEELEALNAKIDEMKNVVKCPNCMAANPIGAIYCARCGAALKTEEKAEEPAQEEQPAPKTDAQDTSGAEE